MADEKKGFVLYADVLKTVSKLPDNKAGELFKHILLYVNDEHPETEDLLIQIAFEPIKQQLKRDLEKWEAIKGKRSSAGKKSAELRKLKTQQDSTNPTSVESVQQDSTNPTVSVNDNVNVNVNVNDNVTVNDIKENKNAIALELLNIKASQFEIFWNSYDKKEGRKKCLAKFLKLKKEDVIKITENVLEYVRSTPDSQYRKNPYTWLNGEHWNDEIIINKPNYGQSNNNKQKLSTSEIFQLDHEQNSERDYQILKAQLDERKAEREQLGY